jgi:hypothetical protein
MSAWFERVRAALAPRGYDVERELASGGMGTVFLARDIGLDGPVAIKVLRPGLWTVTSAQQFVEEARTIRKLQHPHIVPVHDVDESQGLHFYVMDCLAGDTLERHLAMHGRLGVDAARKLGRDLLDALEVAHEHGVIHRDVKPANLFWDGKRAVLTDFGIARHVTEEERSDPGAVRGTAAYMALELFARVEADALTDLYAAAMVIYEAFTGGRWDKCPPEAGTWAGVPGNVRRVLQRGLALDRVRRWPNARVFRRRLWRTRVWRYVRNTVGVAIGFTGLGIGIHGVIWPEPPTRARLRVEAESSTPGLPAWFNDSLACGLARILDRYPDLSVRCVPTWARLWEPDARVRLDIANEGGMVHVRIAGDIAELDTIELRTPFAQWRTVGPTLGDRAFGALLNAHSKVLDPTLPAALLPQSPAGNLAFQQAERHFSRASWSAARAAYATAATLDTTCWLCRWRHAEVGRWFDLQDDPTDSARYRAHVHAFPVYYQSLIRAEPLLEAARLDSLDALARRQRGFLFGQFRRGDEKLHRGPLVGRRRREALEPFEAVLHVQPEFGPAIEHVAWIHVVEGDSADAFAALARGTDLGESSDAVAFAPLAVVQLAYAWRFLPRTEAARRTEELLRRAQKLGFKQLDAGARYLSGFGAPQGGLWFAERLLGEPGFKRSASLARVLALVSLGRPDTAVELARKLAADSPELAIFAEELTAAILAFDGDSARFARAWPAARAALAERADQRVGSADSRWRAAWMLATVARAHAEGAEFVGRNALTLEPGPHVSAALLQAQAQAARGEYDAALASTDTLTGIAAQPTQDPFFRTVLHLVRADWYERSNRPLWARPDLLWHENSDLLGYPTGDPQPAEVDWAFASLAEWRLGLLLERAGGRMDDVCRAYKEVARRWAGGEPRYRARADSAAQKLRSLRCEAAA